MKKKEWIFIFASGFVVGVLYTIKSFYDSYLSADAERFGGLASFSADLMIQKFTWSSVLSAFSIWFLIQLYHLFRNLFVDESQSESEAYSYKKPYLIQFFSTTMVFVLAVLLSIAMSYRSIMDEGLAGAFAYLDLFFFIIILAVLWTTFSIHIFLAYKKGRYMSRALGVFVHTILFLMIFPLLEFLSTFDVLVPYLYPYLYSPF